MVKNITDRSQLPPNSDWVADKIELWNFRWEFDFDHVIPKREHRLQVRDDKDTAPAREVDRLKVELRLPEVHVPPGVVTLDDYIVDSNTRMEAARQLGRPTFPVFIINKKWQDANQKDRARMMGLALDLNSHHGNRMSDEDIQKRIPQIYLYGDVGSTRRIAELLGRTEGFVNSAIWEYRARERAERLGITLNGNMRPTQLRRLGAAKLTDPTFRTLTILAQDAGLTAGEIADLVKKTDKAGSDVAAIEVLEQEKANLRERIHENRLRGGKKPPLAGRARQHLGFFLNYEDAPDELMEHSADKVDDYLGKISRAVAILNRVAEAHQVPAF